MRLRAISATLFFVALVSGVGSSTAFADTNNQTGATATPVSHDVAIQAGDTLTKLSEANSTTYVRLYNANTNISDPDLIFTGDNVRIPAPDEVLADRPLPEKAQAAVAAAPQAVQAAPTKPAYKPAAKTTPVVSDGSAWDRLAKCESGGNWSISTGNGYYGGLQFTLSSWAAVGGSGNPAAASREEQIHRGEILQSRQGWGAWPACSAKLGLS